MPLAIMERLSTALRNLLPLVVALALLLLGCSTIQKVYEGPELTKSELSVIEKNYSHSWMLGMFGVLPIPLSIRHSTDVLEIDGHQSDGFKYGSYHVRTGQHTAKVRYVGHGPVDLCGQFGCLFQHQASLTINFTTEAGHEYRIPAERRGERDWIWVEDITSGKVIAGEKPPDDKGKDPGAPPE